MNARDKVMIGVVGGVGPYAGIDLVRKIFDQTRAGCDQDHLPVSMLSLPGMISDRTEYLLGITKENPGIVLSDVICRLFNLGASVVGIPCNTAHAVPIFDEIVARIPKEINLIHMIDEVAKYIKMQHPSVGNVGILSTTGTLKSNVYPQCLSRHGLNGIQVPEEIQRCHIHPAIYSPEYGIKAQSNPVSAESENGLHVGIENLVRNGVEAVIPGCTEIPLALTETDVNGVPLIDPTRILARALILAVSPEDLLE